MMNIVRRDRPLNLTHQTVVALASRPGGVTNKCLRDALGITSVAAASALNVSARSDRTMSVEHPGDKDHRRRHFTSRAAADAWLAGPAPARVEPRRPTPKLSAIGEPIKSRARQPRPQLGREKAPQGHKWRPDALTAGSSKMASSAASEPASGPKITIGPSPVFGIAARYYVDPATVHGPFETAGIGRDFTGRPWGSV